MMYLSVIFDVGILLIFLFCIYISSKKGFMGSSYKIVSIVLTIVMMFLFQDFICEFISKSPVGVKIEKSITDTLSTRLISAEKEETQNNEENTLKKIGLPIFYDTIIVDAQNEIEETKNEILQKASQSITASVINLFSILLLYVVIRLALFILFKLTNIVFNLPILKGFNRFLGAVAGLIHSLFIVYVLCAILMWYIPNDTSGKLIKAVDESVITGYFYNNNILLELFI